MDRGAVFSPSPRNGVPHIPAVCERKERISCSSFRGIFHSHPIRGGNVYRWVLKAWGRLMAIKQYLLQWQNMTSQVSLSWPRTRSQLQQQGFSIRSANPDWNCILFRNLNIFHCYSTFLYLHLHWPGFQQRWVSDFLEPQENQWSRQKV